MAGPALGYVLKITVECFLDKLKDEAANSLKDGDITELRFREIIIRELNDIRSMLRGMVRQDLIAAMTYFNEGIEILYYHMNNRTQEEKTERSEDEHKEFRQAMALLKRASFKTRKSEQLMNAVEQHVINNLDEEGRDTENLKEARRKLEKASSSATRAISNHGMKDEERILAYKIKIAAILIKNFKDPGIAIPLCKNALAGINSMTLVQQACAVQFGTGLASNFKKLFHLEERDALIRSIASVHRTIWHYIHACALNQYESQILASIDFLQWPLVHLEGRKLHPIYDQEFASYFYRNFGRRGSRNRSLDQPTDIAIDSRGNFIVSDTNNGRVGVWSSEGVFKYDLELDYFYEDEPQMTRPRGVAVDSQDKIYVCDSVSSYVHVFEVGSKSTTTFFTKPHKFKEMSTFSGIHVDNSDRVLVSDIGMKCVHVFTTQGKYLHHFGSPELGSPTDVKGIYISCITTTKDGTVFVTDARHGCIRVYSQNGFLKSISGEAKTFCPVGIAYNPFTREILVSDHSTKHVFVFDESGEHMKEFGYDVVMGVAGLDVTREGHVVLVDDKKSVVHLF